jgi:hypothetical protein
MVLTLSPVRESKIVPNNLPTVEIAINIQTFIWLKPIM